MLEATNGGTLLLVNQNVVNTNNTITATGTGSSLLLQSTTINGGTLATSGGGTMQTVGTATLNGVTLNGNYLADVGTTTYLTGTTSQTGTLTINAGSSNTILNIGGATTLAGGTTTLAYTGSGAGAVYIQQSGGNQTLTNAETIQGTGVIGNGGLTLVNSASGIINANVTGQTLTINPGNVLDAHIQLQNQGVLEATNGGTLLLLNQNVVNTNNTITATGTGSSLLLQSTTINGGTLATSGGGTMQTVGTATLNGVTLNGNYLADVGTTTFLTGTTSQTGTLTINAGSSNTILNIGGATTLAGGTTTLAYTGSGGGRSLHPAVGRQPDAHERRDDPGHRHHRQRRPDARQQRERHHQCQRQVGHDADAESGRRQRRPERDLEQRRALGERRDARDLVEGVRHRHDPDERHGRRHARRGELGRNLINNGSSANALTLGANSVTVSSDYNNANFGVGNAFNKLADVSETTGQILASGNVATAITGTTVTNGTSPTATLTIGGNVHVGQATTYDFQVENTGTSGPAIRGAVQTSVNGAAISDPNLSVTAQNFGPIATGSSSGNIGVNYTASTAGLLSLTGTNTCTSPTTSRTSPSRISTSW